jgi:hypothetical protein
MLGYINDKRDYYNKDNKSYYLRRAIAMSGGIQKHFAIFDNLLSFSIWNQSLNIPLHDTKAAQACLFLYPSSVRIFLSLVLYKEELNLIEECSVNYQLIKELTTPAYQIQYANVVRNTYTSKRLFGLLQNIDENVIRTSVIEVQSHNELHRWLDLVGLE